MIRYQLILFSCLFSFAGWAQEKIILEGKLIADSIGETSINIVNLTQRSGTTNNKSGGFEIEVRENDTLLFSSVQYKVVEMIITPDIFKESYVEVELVEKNIELAEVSISNVNLSGNLSEDISRIKTSTPADFGLPMPSKPPPTSIERKLYTANSTQPRGMANASLDGILNSINGRSAMLQKAKENEERAFLVEKAMNSVPKSFFVESLGLPEDQIKNFVHFCAENPRFPELLPEENRFQLIEYFTKKAPQFLEDRMGK